MKKVLIALLALAVMVSSFALTVFAAGTASVTVSTTAEELKPGDTVTFDVAVSTETAIKSIGFDLKYDTNVFELVSGEWITASEMTMPTFDANTALGVGFGLYNSPYALNKSVFSFSLKVKDVPVYGETSITVDPRMTDTANESVTATATGTSVKVVCVGHSWSGWNTVKDAGFTESGLKERECSNCGELEQESIPALNTPVDLYVEYTEEQKAATVYSIDVVWEEDLVFNYTAGAEGVWDPTNHAYKDSAVAEWKDNTVNVEVTNHSNADVLATVEVTDTDAEDGVAVAPDKTTATLATAVGLAVADADSVTFTLTATGTPVETVSTVASVTISFADAND